MELAIHMFSTSKCPNCLPVKQSLNVLKDNYHNLNLSFTVVDKEADGMVKAQEWGISAVPTLIFIVDATEVYRQVGALPMSELETHVKRYLQPDVLQESSGGSDETSPALLCGVGQQSD
jgi:thioredoxin-like negative regulator of GroEL